MLFIKLLINKSFKNILGLFIFGVLGLVISILPYLLYAVATNSVSDAIYAIVPTNLNYAKSTVDAGKGVMETAILLIKEHKMFYIFLLL